MEKPKNKKRANRNSLDSLYRKRDRALGRVVGIWLRNVGEDPDELNKALDVLTVAHATATFEFASGSFASRELRSQQLGMMAAAPHYRGKLNKRPEARPAIHSLPIQI
jgi:hypothetical protein